jgi:tetratricopeptide (TPR) repeat protein
MLQDFGGLLIHKADGPIADGEHVIDPEPYLRQALELFRQRYGDEHVTVAFAVENLAHMYAVRGEVERAEAIGNECLELFRRTGAPQVLVGPLHLLSGIKISKGEYAEAEAFAREALDVARSHIGSNHPDMAAALLLFAEVKMLRGDYVEAETSVKSALEIQQRSLPEGHASITDSEIILGQILTRTNQAAHGETYLRRALEQRIRAIDGDHWQIAEAKGALGENLLAQRRYAEAEPLLLESRHTFNSRFGPNAPRTQEVARRLDTLYATWNKPAASTSPAPR